jgi:hypothetical protein
MSGREVKVTLYIDETGAVRSMKTAADSSEHTEHKFGQLDKKVKGLGKSFGGLKSIIAGGIGAVGIGGAAFGLKDLISKTSEVAEETHKFSVTTGIHGQASLDYVAALKARGIGAEAGANGFKFLAKNIETAERQEHTFGVAQETAGKKHKATTTLLGVQAKAFQELGINLAQFNGLSEQAKFSTITKKFEGMKDGADKTRLAVQIFGRGGTALLPVLDKGALGLSHFDQMAKRFFPTLKGGANSLEELQEKQAESSMAWEGLEFTLGTKLIPVVTAVTGEFSKLIGEAERGHGTWGTLEHDGEKVVSVLKSTVGWFEKNKVAAYGLGTVLGTVFGVEKIYKFTQAVKGLAILKLFGGGGAAAGAGEAEAAAAGGSMLLPYVGIAAAAIYAASKLHLFGENLANTTSADKRAHQGKLPGAKTVESLRGHFYLAHPYAASKGISGLSGFNDQWLAKQFENEAMHPYAFSKAKGPAEAKSFSAEMTKAAQAAERASSQPTKVDLHLDSKKVAEAFMHNPESARIMAELVAQVSKKEKARQ